MEQQTPLLSVSFLPTKQDYADYQIAACNAAASPGERLFLRAAGFVLVVAGFVLCLLFGVGNPQNTVFFSLLVLLGLAVGFFHDSIQPLLVRSRADLDARRSIRPLSIPRRAISARKIPRL